MNLCREKTGREDASQHATTKKCLSGTPRARKTAGQQREDPRRLECHFALFRNRPREASPARRSAGRGASGESPGSIKSEVAKLAFLRQLGAPEWDLSDLNPNRRKFLAQVGRRSTSQTLQRMPDRRRYPILVVLLHETTLDLVDEIVDLLNRALKKTDSRSRTVCSRPGESRPLRPPTRRSACSHVWDVSFSTRTSRTSSCVDASSRRSRV